MYRRLVNTVASAAATSRKAGEALVLVMPGADKALSRLDKALSGLRPPKAR